MPLCRVIVCASTPVALSTTWSAGLTGTTAWHAPCWAAARASKIAAMITVSTRPFIVCDSIRGVLLSRFEKFIECLIEFAADGLLGGALQQLLRHTANRPLVHLRASQRAGYGDIDRPTLEARKQGLVGNPCVLDRYG